jgi:hypothetical protein
VFDYETPETMHALALKRTAPLVLPCLTLNDGALESLRISCYIQGVRDAFSSVEPKPINPSAWNGGL